MTDPTPTDDVLLAGDFGDWLDALPGAIDGEHDADVPCGTCTGCCTSSQFIAIGPDEVDTLRAIPAALRFPAPGRPKGHVLLGYDEHGHCPMLVDGACTIYDRRPRTCRTYDCRVFPAAGLEPDEATKAAITERVHRWRFAHPRPDDAARHDAVRAAAVFIRAHVDEWPAGSLPATTTHQAVLATQIHELFLAGDPDPSTVRGSIDALRP
jgi:Fe-S-cluster containining protein